MSHFQILEVKLLLVFSTTSSQRNIPDIVGGYKIAGILRKCNGVFMPSLSRKVFMRNPFYGYSGDVDMFGISVNFELIRDVLKRTSKVVNCLRQDIDRHNQCTNSSSVFISQSKL